MFDEQVPIISFEKDESTDWKLTDLLADAFNSTSDMDNPSPRYLFIKITENNDGERTITAWPTLPDNIDPNKNEADICFICIKGEWEMEAETPIGAIRHVLRMMNQNIDHLII